MNTSSQKFDALIADFPDERNAIQRLAQLIHDGRRRRMTLDHLILTLQPDSFDSIVRILARLTRAGVIDRLIQVEEPETKAPIATYPSVLDVPEQVYDPSTGQTHDVRLDDLRVIYTV